MKNNWLSHLRHLDTARVQSHYIKNLLPRIDMQKSAVLHMVKYWSCRAHLFARLLRYRFGFYRRGFTVVKKTVILSLTPRRTPHIV